METFFGGRNDELRLLNELFNKAANNSVQICFVAGYRGDGKTTLVEHFAADAQERFKNLTYAIGGCQQTTQEKSYEPFQDIFSQLTGIQARELHATFGGEREFSLKQKIQIATQTLVDITPDLIGVLVPGVSLLTKVAGTVANQVIKRRIDASKDTNIRIDQINEQCQRFLTELADKGSLILVFDDVQWIDNSSFNLLQYLQGNLSNLPILIIATYRPNEITDEFANWITTIKVELGNIVIDLHMTESDIRRYEFIESFLQQNHCNVDKEFIEEFSKRTEARPVFAVELLRYLRSSHVLTQNALGIWEENDEMGNWIQIPTRITELEALIDSRLKLIDNEFMDMLRIASVEGYEFTAQVIVNVTGKLEIEVLESLSNILELRHGLIKEIGEESIGSIIISRFRFTNILYQEHIYSQIGLGVRRIRHNDIAETLEEIFDDDTGQIAVQLAYHYEKALKLPKAAEYLVVVGKQQLTNRQSKEAMNTLERALSLARNCDYIRGVIDSLRYMGVELIGKRQFAEAEPLLQESIKLARDLQYLSALSYALRGLGRIRAAQQQNSEAMYYYMESLNLGKQNDELESMGASLTNIGVLANAEKRFEDAKYFFEQRLEIAERMNSDDGRFFGLINLGSNARKTGQLEQAKKYFQRGLEIVSRSQDWQRECGLKIGLAYVAAEENNFYEASRLLVEALNIATTKNDRPRQLEGLICAADIFARIDNIVVAAKIIGYMENSKELTAGDRAECTRIRDILAKKMLSEQLVSNLQLGLTVDDQELLNETNPILLQIIQTAIN